MYLGVGSESTEAHFASRDGSDGINDDGYKGLLEVLVQHLRRDIDARQPAAVPGVAVVPSNGIFLPANLKNKQYILLFLINI